MHALAGQSMPRRQASGAARAGDRHRCDRLDRAPAPAPPTGGALACARLLRNALRRPQQQGVQAAHAADAIPLRHALAQLLDAQQLAQHAAGEACFNGRAPLRACSQRAWSAGCRMQRLRWDRILARSTSATTRFWAKEPARPCPRAEHAVGCAA